MFWIAGFLIVLPLAYVGTNAVSLWRTWATVERETYDEGAFDALPPVPMSALESDEHHPADETATEPTELAGPTQLTAAETQPAVAGTQPAGAADLNERYDTYMVVGSDIGDHRADVIILVMLPVDGSAPLMVSLPRDLYLPNRCTQGLTRLNANFNGCGTKLNGASLLSGAVEDFTGIEVDHFALFTMDGFKTIVDQMGGTEICVEHPVREDTRLDLPAGCSQVDGTMALGWVRSRKTEEFVDGRWRTMAGVSDLTRNQRQQDLILSMMSKAAGFKSPQDLTGFVQSLGGAFTLDDRLGLREAVNLAWDHRDVRPESVVRMTIPVRPYETKAGAQVLVATKPFQEVLAEHLSR